ncbi:uncharacterized protein PHACADRAFT_266327 [Phanerochaete carnosa HHB-10118-sp]|uniref:Uncharacterized protein n=1 Tax=Phanerochaete carnosa (strain HHB-10118-sp) TaxID=650164 RepID=K5VBL5_PHACS|nr:uncharacterized protein PHACADRAFT_266327 [Phanerochaete carnosa HHB-10118-sp]EKM48498.1 hypothetical protein PHACADRAFT_266327 [Phanerochaete carnosa HHB-10118-sp]
MPLLISLLEHRKEHGLGVKRLDIDFGTKIGPRDEFERYIGKLEALVEELEYRNETSEDKVRHLRWRFW